MNGCPEGALQIIDGKAKLVGEFLCDGLGACIGTCPEGAITIEEREAEKYEEKKVIGNIVQGGEKVIAAHFKHLKDHHQHEYLKEAVEYLKENNIPIPSEDYHGHHMHGGCPGSMMRDFKKEPKANIKQVPVGDLQSELGQWPIQLHLLNPHASYFKDADLVVAADCIPFAYANFHQRFLKGKRLIIFCPKLDQSKDVYIEKLMEIIKHNNIKSITVLHMEVPCCFGIVAMVEEVLKQSGKNVIVKDYTISIQGKIV